MNPGEPSRTALSTAAARAAHLVVDHEPWIFEDTLGAVLLGDLADELVAVHRDPALTDVLGSMRVAMTTRSRYTEDRLAEVVQRGTRQCVLLGAGLDSFAYRSPLAGQLHIFEVDHPVTQAWKRERLEEARIPVVDRVTYAPVDFRVDSLIDCLVDVGFDRSQPAFVSWLGVTQYLPDDAIAGTLDVIAGFAPGTELVMEYLVPEDLRDRAGQALADFFLGRAAAFGEPWLTFLTPADAGRLLSARGMVVADDIGRMEQVDRSLWDRRDGLRPHELGRLVRAVLRRP